MHRQDESHLQLTQRYRVNPAAPRVSQHARHSCIFVYADAYEFQFVHGDTAGEVVTPEP